MAQIVRDFMESFVRSREIGVRLAAGELEFAEVEALAGEHEGSSLFRLKEECHALFRMNDARPQNEVQAEELFDLAVGALFHENMKFREGYYTTATYGPRLARMRAEGSASGPLVEAFTRVFRAGRRRMLESEAEAEELFRETRDQLLIVLRQMPASGVVARCLIEDPERTERVFAVPLPALLEDIYGSASCGYATALESLLESGHFGDAERVLARPGVSTRGTPGIRSFARGMALYLEGDFAAAVRELETCVRACPARNPRWQERARLALEKLAVMPAVDRDAALVARELAEELSS